MSVKPYNPLIDKAMFHSSPEDYLEYLRANERRIKQRHMRASTLDMHFTGLSWDESLGKLQYGDDALAGRASKIVDKMNDENILSIGRSIIDTNVVGFMPNVPAVLAGIPNNMFQRTMLETENELAPLSIYIDTSVSAGVSNDEIINRGVAVLAFVMAMNTVRPIDLYVTSTWAFTGVQGTACNVVKITTNPIDLARATWILTAREYVRRFSFAVTLDIMGKNSYGDSMPPGWHDYSYSGPHWEQCLRQLLSINPQDVVLGGGSIYNEQVRSDPISWVRDMIKQHAGRKD